MEQTYQLNEQLKKLKLPGVINNLESRAKEAHEHNLGYVEFLSLLTISFFAPFLF